MSRMRSNLSTVERTNSESADVGNFVKGGMGHLPSNYLVPHRDGSEFIDDFLRRLAVILPTKAAIIGVVGYEDQVYVSNAVINLAVRAADLLLTPTLLVDANFRSSRVTRQFGRYRKPGLADLLTQNVELGDCVFPAKKVDGLDVLGSGNSPQGQRAALHPAMFYEICANYRLSILHLPPCLGPSQADGCLSGLDGLVVVARHGDQQSRVSRLTQHVRATGGNPLGVMITGEKQAVPSWLRRWL